MHSNIAACALFAATSGSSVATAATVGTVALPQARRFGYNERLFLGTLAAGGTLGILIPPSINMIIYAVLTNTSVPKLYLAGMIPGLVLCGLFMLTIVADLPRAPGLGRQAHDRDLGRALRGPGAPAAAACDLPGRGRLDLRRHRHAHGGGVARRGGRARPRLVEGKADPRDAARGRRRHDAFDGDGDADFRRRLLPQLRDLGDRPHHAPDELHRASSG